MSQVLDKGELHLPALAKIQRHLEQRLLEHREQNDQPQDDQSTAILRGRIAELKFIKDLLATGES